MIQDITISPTSNKALFVDNEERSLKHPGMYVDFFVSL